VKKPRRNRKQIVSNTAGRVHEISGFCCDEGGMKRRIPMPLAEAIGLLAFILLLAQTGAGPP
jgi:hypothetical protein